MTKTIQIFSAIILNPAEKGKDNTCYIAFEEAIEKNNTFIDEAKNTDGLVKLIEKEIESIKPDSYKNLNIEYSTRKGHYFHDKTKTTYLYGGILSESISKISKKLTKYCK
ncbi:hypothetical protein J4411_01900 [Candidatus Pacearchaeota archaeon]|nr:hypothetical protein [Candidatus Pacearchaeota archaeon]